MFCQGPLAAINNLSGKCDRHSVLFYDYSSEQPFPRLVPRGGSRLKACQKFRPAIPLDLIQELPPIFIPDPKPCTLLNWRKRSLNSAVIKLIERKKVDREVDEYTRRLRLDNPEILRVIWFGSWVHGHPVPGSDVDLCLILSHTDLLSRDRISKYLPSGFPVGLDLLAYTQQEFEQLEDISPGLKREILLGMDLFKK
jgi:uncharacterized protein